MGAIVMSSVILVPIIGMLVEQLHRSLRMAGVRVPVWISILFFALIVCAFVSVPFTHAHHVRTVEMFQTVAL